MVSPNVVNLAAKLFALPALTPAQVIELIRRGATVTEDGRRHLIDEKRSLSSRQKSECSIRPRVCPVLPPYDLALEAADLRSK
jgi:hypothetical protein